MVRSNRGLWGSVALVAVLGAAGCGRDDAEFPGPEVTEVRKVIGSAGGVIGADRGRMAGAKATFPAGALTRDTEIVMRLSPLAVAGAVGPVIEFRPDGATFRQPVRLTLPYDPARVPAAVDQGDLVATLALPGGALERLDRSAADIATRTVAGRTLHFSAFVPVLPDAPGLAQPPVASAGPDRTVAVGAQVQLDGSASSDINGDALVFRWTLVERPAGSAALLSDVAAARPRFVADLAGRYVAELVVNDGDSDSDPDRVTVSAGANSAPVAQAGADQTVMLGASVTLDASASSDADGDPLTYAWSFDSRPAGSTAQLSDTAALMPQFTADRPGDYRVRLVVNDGTADSVPDTVRISTLNTPPVASAGADQSARVGDTVALDGSGSSDADGDALSYAWSFTSRPTGSAAVFADPAQASTTFVLDVAGDYVVQLVVSDAAASDADSATVTTLNSIPVARAGADREVVTASTVTLDGSASSDVDGDPLTFQWSLTTRPPGSTAVVANATQALASFVADRPGQYVAQLIVNDGAAPSAPDTVNIASVEQNLRPVAEAGANRAVQTGAPVTLDGNGSSDANGDPLTFSWSLLSRPAGSAAVLTNPTSVTPTFTPDLAGDYIAQLIVSDGALDSEPDTLTVSAAAPGNRAPTADAGSDASVPAGDGLRLDGSNSSDPDGDPLTFDWAIQQAPAGSAAALLGADLAEPLFTPDLAGDYVLRLIVSDGTASSTPDTVSITATARPAQNFENCGDSIDNDSNGQTDFADAACQAACDLDGDGRNGAQCSGPDTDDDNPQTFPGAIEACGDGLDNDGDGLADEDCYAGTIALVPEDLVIVAGDRRVLSVIPNDGDDVQVNWVYRVEGVEGGTPGTGLLEVLPATPDRAQFTAPFVSQETEVDVSATDPLNPARVATTTIRVVPLGPLEIRPPRITLGLGGNVDFQVGQEVEGVGFVRIFNGLRWRVNGVQFGSTRAGKVDGAGRYKAPLTMPAPLPFPIDVGVALSDAGADVVRAPIRLAALDASPGLVRSQDSGAAGQITAALRFSDNTGSAVPASSLIFQSGNNAIALAFGDGAVNFGTSKVGQTAIRVTHKNLFVSDDVLIDSRSRVVLVNEVSFQGQEDALVAFGGGQANGATAVEYSTPGAEFRLVPSIRFLRGQDGGTTVPADRSDLTLVPDSADLVVYSLAQGLPDLANKVAAINRETGLVTIGRKAGTGNLRVDYNDGLVTASKTIEIRFTRPQLAASVRVGDVTTAAPGPVTGFIFDRYSFKLTLDNPRKPTSSFVDRTVLRVRREDGGEFGAQRGRDLVHGGAVRTSIFEQALERTRELSFDVAPSRNRGSSEPGEPANFAATFSVQLLDLAPAVFIVDVPGDPDLAPVRVTLQPRRPTLATSLCDVSFDTVPNPTVLAGGGAIPVTIAPSLATPAITRRVSSDYGRERLVWRITDPADVVRTVPVLSNFVPFLFGQPGRWIIQQLMPDLPGHESEPLSVTVLDASDTVASRPRNPGNASPGNTLGTVELIGSPPGSWVPGAGFNLSFQTYNVGGAARLIGSGPAAEGDPQPDPVGAFGVRLDTRSVSFSPTGGDPDSGGVSTIRVVPDIDADPAADMVLSYAASFRSITSSAANQPTGIASFIDPRDRGYLSGCIVIPGRGLVVSPRELPIASLQVREAAAAGALAGTGFDDKLHFTLHGGPGFGARLAAGVQSLNLGPNVTVESTTVVGERLEVVARTALSAEPGPRDFVLRFNGDPGEWRGSVTLVRAEMRATTSHSDRNLPLNADHHGGHPPGTQVFEATGSIGFLHSLVVTVDLVPSLDEGETFRGIEVDQPLLAFNRVVNSRTGEIQMLGQRQDVLMSVNGGNFLVFGNTTDRYRRDPQTGLLCATGPALANCKTAPDLLPDYVSATEDAELVLMSVRGNLLDLERFTAFNLVTEMQQQLTANPLAFDSIRSSLDDNQLRQRYSGVTPAVQGGQIVNINDEAGGAIATRDSARTVGVFVDNESGKAGIPARRNILNNQFFAGVLDQWFLERESGYSTVDLDNASRMHGFNGERGSNVSNVTGVTRAPFGIELDGVLYDPTLLGIDEDPNGPQLTAPPIVTRLVGIAPGGGAQLTPDGLLREQGGTSGGYVDLDTDREGAHRVVAKTPGFELPGVPAGFLVTRRPDQLFKGCNSSTNRANDYDDVVIKRPGGPGTRIGGPLSGLSQLRACPVEIDPRRVLSMGGEREKRAPVATGMRAVSKRLVTTDPPGLDAIKFRGALLVRERNYANSKDGIGLMVNTRSTGDEQITKAIFDETLDVSIKLASGVFLNMISAGGYYGACGPSSLTAVGGEVVYGALTVGANAVQSEVFGSQTEKITAINALAQDGVTVVDGTGISVSFKNVLPVIRGELPKDLAGIPKAKVDDFRDMVRARALLKLPICRLLNAPFSLIKSELQNQVTIEALGGNGSAAAYGRKTVTVLIPAAAVRSPGVVAIGFESQRRVEIFPGEEFAVPLADMPGPSLLKPDSTSVSDFDFLARLYTTLEDPDQSTATKTAALAILNKARVAGLIRAPADEHDEAWEEHRLRFMPMPLLEGVIVPGQGLGLAGTGDRVADFELETGVTELPLAAASLTTASRSNENAGARAAITSEGYELLILKAEIPLAP